MQVEPQTDQFREPTTILGLHDADTIALATEKRDLMAEHPDAWPCLAGTQPAAFRIHPWSSAEASQHYLNRLMALLATTNRARAAA